MEQAATNVTTTTATAAERLIVTTPDSIKIIDPSAMIISLYGYQINLATVLIVFMIIALVMFMRKVQRDTNLDFADMVTSDGKKVSLSKFIQLIGGLSVTWFILRQGLDNKLSEGMFGLYLTFIASVEGFAKFMTAKYGYQEGTITSHPSNDEANKSLADAAASAATAENAARDAKVSALDAANEIK